MVLKTGQSMASDFAQYDEDDWKNEKERMVEHYKEEDQRKDQQ